MFFLIIFVEVFTNKTAMKTYTAKDYNEAKELSQELELDNPSVHVDYSAVGQCDCGETHAIRGDGYIILICEYCSNAIYPNF